MTESEHSKAVPASNYFFELMQNLYYPVYFDTHVNLPAQMDTSAPRWVLKECRLWPKAQVCIPQHRSVAYLLQQSMCRKPLIAQWSKLSEEQNRDHMLPHSFWKQVKRLHHHCLENKRIHLILKLSFSSQLGADMDIQLGWDSLTKNPNKPQNKTNKQTNEWLWATCHIRLLWYQSAKRLS